MKKKMSNFRNIFLINLKQEFYYKLQLYISTNKLSNKSKKLFDKRESIKEKDIKRKLERELKNG